MRRLIVTLGLASLTGLAAVAVHDGLGSARAKMPDDAQVLYVPEPAYLRPMSLGYREALADLLWVRALIFSGVSLGDTEVAAVERYAGAIAGLAPRFERVYHWGGVTAIYGGPPKVDREMTDTAIAIYRQGLEHYPESHKLLYGLGMTLMHQVDSTPGYSQEERAAAKTEGAKMIRRAAAFGADPLVRQYAATLVSEHATDALARQFLEAELARVEDPEYRRMLRTKLSELAGASSVEAVERVRTDFMADHRARLPYVSDALFAVLRDEAAAEPPPLP